jgi:hypothetical protein
MALSGQPSRITAQQREICLSATSSEIRDDMANALIIFGVSVTLGAMAGFGINLARSTGITPTASPIEATHPLNGPLASLTPHNKGWNTSADAGTNALAEPLDHDEAEAADESNADSDDSATSTNEESSEAESAQTDSSDEPPPADDSAEQDSTEPESAETVKTEPGSHEPASADADSTQADSPEVASTAQSGDSQTTEDSSS